MHTAKKDQVKAAPVFGGAAKKEKTSGDSVREGLRGKGFAEQEQALKPAGPDGQVGNDGKDGKKPSGAQAGPHAMKGLGAGRFHLFVEGQDAYFAQQVAVHGAKASLPEEAPPVGVPVLIDATGVKDWSLSVRHKVKEGTAKDWTKGRESWSPSTHKEVSRGPDHLDVGTEDFKDNDFNDLVLSVVRLPEGGGGELEGGGDGAYLVESETKVEGYQTSYDLILGASASGRLDVVLNAQVISVGELGGVDGQALAAMAERFADLRGKLAGSVDHAAKRKQLEEEIARWERAVAMARAKAPGAKKAPEAKASEPGAMNRAAPTAGDAEGAAPKAG